MLYFCYAMMRTCSFSYLAWKIRAWSFELFSPFSSSFGSHRFLTFGRPRQRQTQSAEAVDSWLPREHCHCQCHQIAATTMSRTPRWSLPRERRASKSAKRRHRRRRWQKQQPRPTPTPIGRHPKPPRGFGRGASPQHNAFLFIPCHSGADTLRSCELGYNVAGLQLSCGSFRRMRHKICFFPFRAKIQSKGRHALHGIESELFLPTVNERTWCIATHQEWKLNKNLTDVRHRARKVAGA